MPVQEFPIEKKTEEDDDSSMQPDTSLYKEDGSLEVSLTLYQHISTYSYETRTQFRYKKDFTSADRVFFPS